MHNSKKPYIRIDKLSYSYGGPDLESSVSYRALNNIGLNIDRGEYVAVIGANGSGKSTLLRHLNGLLIPKEGDVWVGDWNTRDVTSLQSIRSHVGMVFQSPDDQIVATVVEEEVAFGPENIGVPENELATRVTEALEQVGLSDLRNRPTHSLSAGQKQLLAVASVLSMRPDCLVLDEATASLDPLSRSRLLQTVDSLHRHGITVITATHRMEEAARATRVVALHRGEIGLQGSPKHVFLQQSLLEDMMLDIPVALKIARYVASRVTGFTSDSLTVDELVAAVIQYRGRLHV
jgi:energy-coupling factor transporter ATPase